MKHSTTKPDERTPMEKAIEFVEQHDDWLANHLKEKFLPLEKEERRIMEECVIELERQLLAD